jgi:PAS domain S-box-containing protein
MTRPILSPDRTILVIDRSGKSTGDDRHLLQREEGVSYRVLIRTYDNQIPDLCRTEGINCILLESHYPNLQGFEVLEGPIARMGKDCPPIIAIDRDDAELAVRALKAGAADYLARERLTFEKLHRAIECAIAKASAIQPSALEAGQETQTWMELSLTSANLGVWRYNVTTDEFWADDRAKLLHGREPHEVHNFAEAGANIHPEDRDRAQAAFAQAILNSSKLQIEYRIICPDGSIRWIASRAEYIPSDRDEGIFYGIVQDISARQQVESEWREAQTRLELSLRSANFGVWIYNVSTGEFWADDRAKQMHGHEPHEVHTFEEAGANVYPEDRDRAQLAFNQAIQNGSKIQIELRVIWRDGSIHWIASNAEYIPGDRGEGIFYGVVQDISDRKYAEQNIATDLKDTQLLRDLSARLVNENDIQAFYQEIMATAIALTRADAGTVQILDEATQDLVLLATQGFKRDMTDRFHRVNASSNTPCGIALATGDKPDGMAKSTTAVQTLRTFVDFDVPESQDPDGSMRMHVEAGYLSAQSTPLVTRTGKPIGMVSTHWRKKHRPSDRELGFLDLLARQAADLIEQRQAQQVIQESEALLQKALSIETVGVLFFSLEGRMTGANETFVRMIGYSRDELLNTVHWDVLTPPEFIDVTAHAAQELSVRGETAPYEKQMIRKDGSRWWGLFAPTRLKGKGSASECVEFIIDITERKHQEQHQSMLSEIADELVRLNNVAETMDRLGKKIGCYFGVKQCIFTELTEDLETSMAAYGWNAEGSPSLKGTYQTRDFLSDEQIAANMAGTVTVVGNTQTDTRVSAESYGALGIHSFVIVPLVRDKLWRFMFSIIDNKPRQWHDDEVDLMREITNRIWTRLERIRAEEAVRESELQRIREQAAREKERQRAETLAELDRAKTIFFSNVSHEFRTPLTLLLSPLQEVLSDRTHPLAPPQRERLELAHRHSQRLLKLVNTLLDFSRIEADRLEANYEPTDLSTYTADLASRP